MAEIMMGSGKRLGLSTGMARCRGDEEAKKLFAETADRTMWHSYLGKVRESFYENAWERYEKAWESFYTHL